MLNWNSGRMMLRIMLPRNWQPWKLLRQVHKYGHCVNTLSLGNYLTGTKALDHVSLENCSTGNLDFPFLCLFKARFFQGKMCKNSLHFKGLHPWTAILKQKTNCLFPCKHRARLLRNLGITSTEHTFTKGTWFSSSMPVSFLAVAHTINVVHTNLVLVNTQLQQFLGQKFHVSERLTVSGIFRVSADYI